MAFFFLIFRKCALLLLAALALPFLNPSPALSGQAPAGPLGLTKGRAVVDARQYPFSAVGRVQWAGIREKAHCTGALIGERLVLTAAHCLFSLRTKKWIKPGLVHFVAGYHKGVPLAHSVAVRYFKAPQFDLTKGITRENLENDWALVELQAPIGKKVGYLGWRAMDAAAIQSRLQEGWQVLLTGYPQDRSHVISVDNDCRAELKGHLIVHDCFTTHGDSGGPLLLVRGAEMTVIGLNSSKINESNVSRAVPLVTFEDVLKQSLGLTGALSANQMKRLSQGQAPAL